MNPRVPFNHQAACRRLATALAIGSLLIAASGASAQSRPARAAGDLAIAGGSEGPVLGDQAVCHSRSDGPPATACANGKDGEVCVEQIVTPELILPDGGFAHSPLRIELERCADDSCGTVRVDRLCDLEIDVQRQGADPLSFEVTCESPTFVKTLSNVTSVKLRADCRGANACGYKAQSQKALARWQLCHLPGEWIKTR